MLSSASAAISANDREVGAFGSGSFAVVLAVLRDGNSTPSKRAFFAARMRAPYDLRRRADETRGFDFGDWGISLRFSLGRGSRPLLRSASSISMHELCCCCGSLRAAACCSFRASSRFLCRSASCCCITLSTVFILVVALYLQRRVLTFFVL